MVSLAALWLPILLSAIVVFLASSVIHMMLTYHRSDFRRMPAEDQAMAALASVPPGDYVMPYAATPAEMKAPEYLEKRNRGPIAVLTVLPAGPPSMGKNLAQWFVFSIIVSIFAAYIAGRALPPAADYLGVFRFTGATAFVGYGLGNLPNSIWYGRAWGATFRNLFDALVYALLTAGVFGWLWP